MHELPKMAAEWGKHARTWMCWPTRSAVWGGSVGLMRAKRAFADAARTISAFEPVTMAVCPKDVALADAALGGCAEVFPIEIDDSWMRDTGPTFLRGPDGLSAISWRFNAWGEKYTPYAFDAKLAAAVAGHLGIACRHASLFCEGGALHTDGEGTLLVTEQTLCNPNRNPGLSRAAIEQDLLAATGTDTAIWLGDGFADDETDGHIDNIACFAAPAQVLVGVPAFRSSPDWEPVHDAIRRLQAARDAKGRALQIVEVPQPVKTRFDWRGRPLNASYINFIFVDGGIVLPQFDDDGDEAVLSLFRRIFPSRKIVPFDVRSILEGGGGLHCIALSEPSP